MRTWNPHLYPPGGFVFKDADGIEHRGGNIEDLAYKIAEYRLRRDMPPGNPVAEATEQLCTRYPSRCRRTLASSGAVLAKTKANALMSAVAVWLRETWRRVATRQVTWASTDVVKARVATCLACKYHQVASVDCPTCQDSLDRVSFQLRAGRDRDSGRLSMCNHYQRDARVDVLLEDPPDPQAPEPCWKRPPTLPGHEDS